MMHRQPSEFGATPIPPGVAPMFYCWPYLPEGNQNRPCTWSGVEKEDLRSYYDPPDGRCLEITPAFFKPSVLDRYLAAPNMYKVEERSISAHHTWNLKTYDINDEGQVHTYLVYLGDLPLQEQQYWMSFNEAPKGPISARAQKTDIEDSYGPETAIDRLQRFAQRQEKQESNWWQCKNLSQLERYLPCTNGDALEVWKSSILLLHQVTVENLTKKYFMGGTTPIPKQERWDSVKWVSHWLNARQIADRQTVVDALKDLRHLRNFHAHGGSPEAATKAQTEAWKAPGRLRGHSIQLTESVVSALEMLEKIIAGEKQKQRGVDNQPG